MNESDLIAAMEADAERCNARMRAVCRPEQVSDRAGVARADLVAASRALYLGILTDGPSNCAEVARKAKVSRAGAHYGLGKLCRAGLAVRAGDRYAITDAGRAYFEQGAAA
jgi:hypothetical protein